MKKLLYSLLAVLFFLGMAVSSYAVSLPQSEDAENGPGLWMIPVYNNEASTTLDVGDCVEWDIGSSTGDNDNYVVQCDSVDTFLVAGVVYPSDIGVGETGTIVIRGVVDVDTTGSGVQAGTLLCSSATGGSFQVCSDTGTDANGVGFAINAAASSSAKAFIGR